MKPNKTLISSFFLLSLIFLLCSSSFAERSMITADFYAKRGKTSYKKGDMPSAIKYFSKALLIDPNHAESKRYLGHLGLDGSMFGIEKLPVDKIATLSQELAVYKNKLTELKKTRLEQQNTCDKLEAKNSELCASIEVKDDEINFLKTKIGMVEENLKLNATMTGKKDDEIEDHKREVDLYKRTTKQHINLVEDLEQSVEEKSSQIDDLHVQLETLRADAISEYDEYETALFNQEEDHNAQVKYYKKQFRAQASDFRTKERASKKVIDSLEKKIKKDQQSVSQLKDKIVEKDFEIAKLQSGKPDVDEMFEVKLEKRANLMKEKDAYIAELKEKVVSLIKQVDTLSEKPTTDDDQSALKRQINDFKIRLERRDSILEEKTSENNILEQRLSDAHERLSLVEEIVDEKDVKIEELKKKLIEIRDQCIE